MKHFILIELDSTNEYYEDDADQVRHVARLVENGLICDHDKHTRYEKVSTTHDVDLHSMAVKFKETVFSEGKIMDVLHSLHGRVANGADIDAAIQWAYEELEEI